MATTLFQEWLPNLRFIVKYGENQPFSAIFALPGVFDVCLSRCKACDRYAEGAARYVVQADLVAELDGRRIAAVFAADTAMNVAAGSVSHFDSHIHKLPTPVVSRRANGSDSKILFL